MSTESPLIQPPVISYSSGVKPFTGDSRKLSSNAPKVDELEQKVLKQPESNPPAPSLKEEHEVTEEGVEDGLDWDVFGKTLGPSKANEGEKSSEAVAIPPELKKGKKPGALPAESGGVVEAGCRTEKEQAVTSETKAAVSETKTEEAQQIKDEKRVLSAEEGKEIINGCRDMAPKSGISPERGEYLAHKIIALLERFNAKGDQEDLNEGLRKLQQELTPEEFNIVRQMVENKLGDYHIPFTFKSVGIDKSEETEKAKQPMSTGHPQQVFVKWKAQGAKSSTVSATMVQSGQSTKVAERKILHAIREWFKTKLAFEVAILREKQTENKEKSQQILKERISVDELKFEELKTEIQQKGITDARAQFVIKSVVVLVKYLNTAKDLGGLPDEVNRLESELTEEEFVIVSQHIQRVLGA
jgi:hypothetical protein